MYAVLPPADRTTRSCPAVVRRAVSEGVSRDRYERDVPGVRSCRVGRGHRRRRPARRRSRCATLVAAASKIISLSEAVRLKGLSRLDHLSKAPGARGPEADDIFAEASRGSSRSARQAAKRSKTVGDAPKLGEALASGKVSPDHVDVVTAALNKLQPAERALLAGEHEWIAGIAAKSSPEGLAKALSVRVRELRAGIEDDAARLDRQRRSTTLKHWLNDDTGMVCMYGEFDPELGAMIVAAIDGRVNQMFQSGDLPDTCPTDPLDRQRHLQGLATANLICRRTGRRQGARRWRRVWRRCLATRRRRGHPTARRRRPPDVEDRSAQPDPHRDPRRCRTADRDDPPLGVPRRDHPGRHGQRRRRTRRRPRLIGWPHRHNDMHCARCTAPAPCPGAGRVRTHEDPSPEVLGEPGPHRSRQLDPVVLQAPRVRARGRLEARARRAPSAHHHLPDGTRSTSPPPYAKAA